MTEDSATTARGHCHCGRVSYGVCGPMRQVVECHCESCRRLTGSVWHATGARRDDVEIRDEAGALTWYRSSETAERGFCGHCGSTLFFRRDNADTITITAGSLDQPTGLKLMNAYLHRREGRLCACAGRRRHRKLSELAADGTICDPRRLIIADEQSPPDRRIPMRQWQQQAFDIMAQYRRAGDPRVHRFAFALQQFEGLLHQGPAGRAQHFIELFCRQLGADKFVDLAAGIGKEQVEPVLIGPLIEGGAIVLDAFVGDGGEILPEFGKLARTAFAKPRGIGDPQALAEKFRQDIRRVSVGNHCSGPASI